MVQRRRWGSQGHSRHRRRLHCQRRDFHKSATTSASARPWAEVAEAWLSWSHARMTPRGDRPGAAAVNSTIVRQQGPAFGGEQAVGWIRQGAEPPRRTGLCTRVDGQLEAMPEHDGRRSGDVRRHHFHGLPGRQSQPTSRLSGVESPLPISMWSGPSLTMAATARIGLAVSRRSG